MKLNISEITIDKEFQIRAEIDNPTVQKYAELYGENTRFPALSVWETDEQNILIDGFHRIAAMKEAGYVECEVIVFSGTKTQAMVEAARSNHSHGRPLTGADLRATIAKLIECDREMSNASIATAAGCSGHTVQSVRDAIGMQTTRVKGRDGKSYPAKLKREPRPGSQDADESDRDDSESSEPPPDDGMGGDRNSPEELAKSEKRRAPKSEILDYCDMAIKDLTEGGYEATVSAMMTVKAWIKS